MNTFDRLMERYNMELVFNIVTALLAMAATWCIFRDTGLPGISFTE